MSSARISASRVLPKLVRSPHSTRTSALAEISVNSSRSGVTLSSITWRSPIAATRSLPSVLVAILLFEIADGVGEAPLVHVDRIVARGEDAAAAHPPARPLHFRLIMQPLEQFVHQPSWDAMAFARVDEAEVEERNQQHLPI